MSTRDGFKVLRVKTPIVSPGDDDDDWAALQTIPPDLIFLPEVQPNAVNDTDGVALFVEWLDVAGDIVAGRGSFTLTYIQVVDRIEGNGFDIGGKGIADSVEVLLVPGYKVVTIDGIRGGGELGLRFSTIVPPGAATQMRILYREL